MKVKIVKAQSWDWETRLKSKGFKDGDKVVLSLPVRKGVRRLVKGRFRVLDRECGCCGPVYSVEREGKELLRKEY